MIRRRAIGMRKRPLYITIALFSFTVLFFYWLHWVNEVVPETPQFVSGIFVAPELSSGASAEEWEASMRNMAEIGIDTVIIQYSYQMDSENGNQAYFNYHAEDTVGDADEHPHRRDQIGWILAAAQEHGMQVYLGLQKAEREWFDLNSYRDYDWLYHHYWLSGDLADALWSKFGLDYADTIAGWYLPFEFESSPAYYDYFEMLADVYYYPLTSELKNSEHFDALPIMISPLMYRDDDIGAWKKNLSTVLSGSQIDIVAPQDGIGFGTQSHATVGAWFRASREAVNEVNAATGKSIKLWGNCENYARQRNPNETDFIELLRPMSINKFIDSMEIAAPHVEKLITFSIHRWDTAQSFNKYMGINRSYYEAYRRYFESGIRSESKTDGYFVAINHMWGWDMMFHYYAAAGLTDGLSTGAYWKQFKGISSQYNEPFTLEIRFDDPTLISEITTNFYQDPESNIALPREIEYKYLVRTGAYDQIFNFFNIGVFAPAGVEEIVKLSVSLPSPELVDGIIITITPSAEWTFLDDVWVE